MALMGSSALKLVLGVGLCALSGALMLLYFRLADEDEQLDKARNKRKTFLEKSKKSNNSKCPTGEEIRIEIKIPNQHIPLIAGRSGANLKSIEEKTKTSIQFKDNNDANQICEIFGLTDNVKLARDMILKQIERSPIINEQMFVPQNVCGKITGRCGEAMQEISRISMAKISVDARVHNSNTRCITITGNRQQVNIARKLIEDKIEEDNQLRRTVEEMEQKREPRRSPANSVASSNYSSQNSLIAQLPAREKLLPNLKNESNSMEVYVSAIASPSKFWLQIIGAQSKQLDDLVNTMTEYYNVPENRELHRIEIPYLGQIVATVFKHDNKWYRAEVVRIQPNEYNSNEVVLDMYFVDYGDSEYVLPHEVYELRTDFLTLRFQAVECFLANVKSTLPDDSDIWDEESIKFFEECTQVARWKKLTSRVVTYRERCAPDKPEIREGSPIPGVELYDIHDGVEINLGEMLITQGYALAAADTSEKNLDTSYTSANSHISDEPSSLASFDQSVSNYAAPSSTVTAENRILDNQLQYLQKNKSFSQKSGATGPSSIKEATKVSPSVLFSDIDSNLKKSS